MSAEATAAATRSEREFRLVVEAAPYAIVLVNRAGKIEMVNAQTERQFGYDRAEIIGQAIDVLVPERFRRHHSSLTGTFFSSHQSRPMGGGRDLTGLRKDGSEFPVEIGLSPIETDDGPMVLAAVVDISVRKSLERELGETTELLRATLNAAPFPILVTAPDSTVIMWNQAGERTFGFTAGEMIGGSFMKLVPEAQHAYAAKVFQESATAAQTQGLEVKVQHRDGKVLDVNLVNAPIFYADGRVRAVVSILEDVTQRRAVEAQLRQSQKMEAIGNLTGGMAHDFNNVLGVVIGNLDLLRAARPDDKEVSELALEALDAAVRGAELTRQMLAFARRQPLQPQLVRLNDLVRGITKLLSRVLGENIEIVLNLNDDVCPVVIDPAQLEATLTNLSTNARDAMPRGGRITVATANRELDEDYAAEHADLAPGNYAMIEFSDTGTGIAPDVQSRIYEPFFTTKDRDKGTGLGLSMVFGFMKQSGGHINVYSEVGAGTTFRLYLPCAPDARDEGRTHERPATATTGGRLVLAVEDNIPLRRIVVRQLRELGYGVLEAGNAADAMRLLESNKVDLLLTDVVMPGDMDGFELTRAATARWPSLKIVLTSGFPESQLTQTSDGKVLRLLVKPYRKQDLAQILQSALRG